MERPLNWPADDPDCTKRRLSFSSVAGKLRLLLALGGHSISGGKMNKHISVWILNVLRDSLLQVAPESIKPTEPKGVTRVNKVFGPLTHVAFSLALAASAVLLAGAQASAQCPATPLTSGLQIPLGISQSNQGNLLVSETGTSTPNTGRISVVGLNGTRRTLLDGLPSGLNDVNEPSGPAGLFMRGAPSTLRSA